jgi:hypothetical protein
MGNCCERCFGRLDKRLVNLVDYKRLCAFFYLVNSLMSSATLTEMHAYHTLRLDTEMESARLARSVKPRYFLRIS